MTDATKAIWTLMSVAVVFVGSVLLGGWLIDVGLQGAEALGGGEIAYSDSLSLALGIVGAGFLFRLVARDLSTSVVINTKEDDNERA